MSDSSLLNTALKVLDKAVADVKYRLGTFLQNEKVLDGLDGRLSNLEGDHRQNVSDTGRILHGKQRALLDSQKTIEGEALEFVDKAGSLKTKVTTDPKYGFLKTSPTGWGLRQVEILRDVAAEASRLAGPGAGLADRLVTQNKNVSTLVSETEQAERAASGVGLLPKVRDLITSTVGATASSVFEPLKKALVPLAVISGAAAVIWVMKPGVLRKNPRRRR